MDFDKAYLIVSGWGFLRNCLCLKIEPQLDMSGNLGFPGCEAAGINFNWLKEKMRNSEYHASSHYLTQPFVFLSWTLI